MQNITHERYFHTHITVSQEYNQHICSPTTLMPDTTEEITNQVMTPAETESLLPDT